MTATKSSHATCCKSFTGICGTFGFISLCSATRSNPSRFKAHPWRYIYIRGLRARRVYSGLHEKSASSATRSKARGLPRVRHHITWQRRLQLAMSLGRSFYHRRPERSAKEKKEFQRLVDKLKRFALKRGYTKNQIGVSNTCIYQDVLHKK
jgi:hypothetical protein